MNTFLRFRYLLNPACVAKGSTKMIVLVNSNAKNFRLRQAQRDAFDSRKLEKLFGIRRFFLLAFDNKVNQRTLENESLRHGDIVQGNFLESYSMLSFKHIMGLQWATRQCKFKSQSRYKISSLDLIILFNPRCTQ